MISALLLPNEVLQIQPSQCITVFLSYILHRVKWQGKSEPARAYQEQSHLNRDLLNKILLDVKEDQILKLPEYISDSKKH